MYCPIHFRYSGITAHILQNVKTTIGDVQQRLLELITKDDIIVGHSLDNDFRALKVRQFPCMLFTLLTVGSIVCLFVWLVS